GAGAGAPAPGRAPVVSKELVRQATAHPDPRKQQYSRITLPTKLGSYSWAIAPDRTLSRHPLLLGGPQMGFSTPHVGFEIGLHGAGFDVTGMAFAGMPGVLIGAN